jgi:hypothetical protein
MCNKSTIILCGKSANVIGKIVRQVVLYHSLSIVLSLLEEGSEIYP